LATAVHCGHLTNDRILHRAEELIGVIESAFDKAYSESKIISRSALIETNSRPLEGIGSAHGTRKVTEEKALDIEALFTGHSTVSPSFPSKKVTATCDVMRKHMTKCFDEALSRYKNMMYIGEDVQHGG
jgi:hypothetical protein